MNNQLENKDFGWIKLYRSIKDSQIFASPEGLKIWIWILTKAHHSDIPYYCRIKTGKGYTTIKIFQGQFLFGRKKAALELDMDESMVYRWIKKLASPEYNMISEQPMKHFTIIQVNNWSQYQGKKYENVNNQWTTNEQPMNTDKNDNNEKNGKKALRPKTIVSKAAFQTDTIISAEAEISISDQSNYTPEYPLLNKSNKLNPKIEFGFGITAKDDESLFEVQDFTEEDFMPQAKGQIEIVNLKKNVNDMKPAIFNKNLTTY
jgi:hypothetical protein